jgi:hypothetical protein
MEAISAQSRITEPEFSPDDMIAMFETGFDASGQIRQVLNEVQATFRHRIETIHSNIAQMLADLEGNRGGRVVSSGPADVSPAESRPLNVLRERLLAILAQARSTANQVSLEANQDGIRVLANAIHLSPEERERLRSAMAQLIDAYGYLVNEISLTGDVDSQFSLIGKKS